MHLVDVLSLRPVPAAGVTVGITRRCPLHCAHCSTSSTMTSEEGAADMLVAFVESFGVEDRPEILAMSGGEAMLRPRLVRDLAERARSVGTRSVALSGMFFASSGRVPSPIKEAIDALDHFSASIDAFHEREVSRINVLRVLDSLLADGKDVSIHVCGRDADDPYLESVIEEVQRAFDGKVPMFVNCVSSFGRAREWFRRDAHIRRESVEPNPCGSAAWPLVAFDGTVVACGNDDVVIGPPPEHLRLGHIGTDDWAAIRARCVNFSTIRAIRLFGPEYLADRVSARASACAGYCATCMKLSPDPALYQRVEEIMGRRSTVVLEEYVSTMQVSAGAAVSFARRHGVPRYAELVTCGAST
jgi:pyruvate-formate lyase-activating enzyme